MSEQPKGVREKVKNLLLKTEDESGFDFTYGRPSDRVGTGEEIYRGLAGLTRANNPNAAASAALKEAGIPGIKYLDGSSRSKGEGDYNYVIFDEADVQITDKLFMPAGDQKGYSIIERPAKHFGDGFQKFRITHEESNGFIEVVVKPNGTSSVTQLLVPESFRRQGIGRSLQEKAQELYPNLGGQVSSKYAAKSAYDLGRRPPDNPKASLEEVFNAIDQDSSVNLVSQNQDKLFMDTSEAGAGKGKQAEAAKLWQEKGTDSPYFKKWFGKSKVVDENGEPLVVYRGDRPGKEVFTGRENPYNLIQGNVFFSDNAEVAKFYTDQRTNYLISPEQMNEADGLYGTYLRLKKPLEVDAKENSWTDIPDPFDEGSIQIDDLGEIAQKKGYDGMIIKNVYDQGGFGTQYVAFSPEQIKSATGNRGTFDAGERNILFMPAGGDKLTATHNLSAEALAKADDKVDCKLYHR